MIQTTKNKSKIVSAVYLSDFDADKKEYARLEADKAYHKQNSCCYFEFDHPLCCIPFAASLYIALFESNIAIPQLAEIFNLFSLTSALIFAVFFLIPIEKDVSDWEAIDKLWSDTGDYSCYWKKQCEWHAGCDTNKISSYVAEQYSNAYIMTEVVLFVSLFGLLFAHLSNINSENSRSFIVRDQTDIFVKFWRVVAAFLFFFLVLAVNTLNGLIRTLLMINFPHEVDFKTYCSAAYESVSNKFMFNSDQDNNPSFCYIDMVRSFAVWFTLLCIFANYSLVLTRIVAKWKINFKKCTCTLRKNDFLQDDEEIIRKSQPSSNGQSVSVDLITTTEDEIGQIKNSKQTATCKRNEYNRSSARPLVE